MPRNSLTPEQRQALATRHVSVALSAGAGCGKTHVLTERFLSHLEPGQDGGEPARLHQLIAITFTDAAAREMRSRIRGACYDRLSDPALSQQAADEWVRLLRLIETARISTIHSFCTSLLRQHAVAAGLNPTFGVLDQGDADVLQSESIDDVLRARLAEQDDATLYLAEAFGLARVKQQLQVLVRGSSRADFAPWLDRSPSMLVDTWREYTSQRAWPLAVGEIVRAAPLELIRELLANNGIECAKKPKFAEARAGLLCLLPQLESAALNEQQLDELHAYARVQGICTAKDWPSKDAYDGYSKACKALREAIDKHRPAPFDDAVAHEAARLGLILLQLADAVAHDYGLRKLALGRLDFDDLLHKAHDLITAPESGDLREKLSKDLRLVLVDEFQDTDRLQVELIKTLCGPGFDEGRLFFVGDFKQSIYRFRGAQPDVFRDLRDTIPAAGRLPLSVNFRSQPAILQFVNALFHDAFEDDFQPLRPHREQTTVEPAIEFLWTPVAGKNSNVKGMADTARRAEAGRIARRLRALIDNQNDERPIVDETTQQPRALRPGDVAILFRALSDVQIYEEALRQYDLDYYLVGGHAFYAQQEIYDVLNLLRAVASPADEISLAGVLRSPFFSLEDETLFWLAEAGRGAPSSQPRPPGGTLNAGLFAEQLPGELSAVERAKAVAAAATIRHLRAIKDTVPIATLLGEALARTGYDAVLLAEFLGQRKLANLQKLVERARAADQGTLELAGFITQLAQFIVHQPKEALAATSAEAADVIRLMTIHQAKGLEFPLVVVPDLDRPPRLTTPTAALDPMLGPLVPAPASDDREKQTTGLALFAAHERVEELRERKRLLYVACTRAADHLILSSSLESCDAPKSDWLQLIAAHFDLATGQPAQALPHQMRAPQIRVTLDVPATDHPPASKSRGPDLVNLLAEARGLADAGQGVIPPHVGPVSIDQSARRQFSFSQLSGQLTLDDRLAGATTQRQLEPVSLFLPGLEEIVRGKDESTIDALGLGSLVHAVLARTHFTSPNANSDLAAWCEHLAPQHVDHHEEETAAVAHEMIARLLASLRAGRLAGADALHRELEFLLAWPPGRSIRGYIDCLYHDEIGWHLVDYKTNDIRAASCAAVSRQYELQLYVYALAAERSLGEPPVELVLHFLRPGAEHTFQWNDDARQRATRLINEAVVTLTTCETAIETHALNPDLVPSS